MMMMMRRDVMGDAVAVWRWRGMEKLVTRPAKEVTNEAISTMCIHKVVFSLCSCSVHAQPSIVSCQLPWILYSPSGHQ